ncbi:hypothetical protein F2P81_023676 [Scophthalmus maximus]|uniref:Uncharacterized protein n=1 Tax=Scophthalmus maximus TaxID=52904 RepID=A0A6A4RKN0_SCOMX|nr:hypothetical protein F2P81_023676 [Scophthalmus maximus]
MLKGEAKCFGFENGFENGFGNGFENGFEKLFQIALFNDGFEKLFLIALFNDGFKNGFQNAVFHNPRPPRSSIVNKSLSISVWHNGEAYKAAKVLTHEKTYERGSMKMVNKRGPNRSLGDPTKERSTIRRLIKTLRSTVSKAELSSLVPERTSSCARRIISVAERTRGADARSSLLDR